MATFYLYSTVTTIKHKSYTRTTCAEDHTTPKACGERKKIDLTPKRSMQGTRRPWRCAENQRLCETHKGLTKGQHPGLSDEAKTEVQKAAVHWVADFRAELNLFP